MQWVKYLFAVQVTVLFVWSAWSLHAQQYEGSASMFICALGLAALYHFLLRPHLRQDALMKRLDTSGLQVQASILDVEATSTYLNEVPVMHVKVKYIAAGKEHIHEIRQPIAFQALSCLQRGKRISILVDPKRTEQFVLQL